MYVLEYNFESMIKNVNIHKTEITNRIKKKENVFQTGLEKHLRKGRKRNEIIGEIETKKKLNETFF